MEVTPYTFLFLLQLVNMVFIFMTSDLLQIEQCADHRKDLTLRTELNVATYLNYVTTESENPADKVVANSRLEAIINRLAQDHKKNAHHDIDRLVKYAYSKGHTDIKDGDFYVKKHFPEHFEV